MLINSNGLALPQLKNPRPLTEPLSQQALEDFGRPCQRLCSMDLPGQETYGEVEELFRGDRTARFDWEIPDFSNLRSGVYMSPAVYLFNKHWYLSIAAEQCGIRFISLIRVPATPGILEPVRFSIGWKRADGGVVDIAGDQMLPENSNAWCLDFSRPCNKPPSGQDTLTCILRKGDSPHAEDKTVLSDYFKDLLVSGDHHDLLINVKDKQFRVHKCVLARSPVFSEMFGNRMAEGSVTIEDCDPDTFGAFLHYVYTGEVDIASTGRALDLYYAGVKHDFQSLKRICVEYMKNSITTTTVFDLIHLAARHDEEELEQQAMVYLSTHLEEVMLTVECRRSLVGNLMQANQLCLKALQCLKTSLCHK